MADSLKSKIYWGAGKCKPPRRQMSKSGWFRLWDKWSNNADKGILKHLISIKPKLSFLKGSK